LDQNSASIPKTSRWCRAKLLRRSIKWIEDRREHFTNAAQERDQYWSIEIAVDGDAKVLGIRGRILHDSAPMRCRT